MLRINFCHQQYTQRRRLVYSTGHLALSVTDFILQVCVQADNLQVLLQASRPRRAAGFGRVAAAGPPVPLAQLQRAATRARGRQRPGGGPVGLEVTQSEAAPTSRLSSVPGQRLRVQSGDVSVRLTANVRSSRTAADDAVKTPTPRPAERRPRLSQRPSR
jgi:hypothetical protein